MSPNLTAIANEFDMDNIERDRKLGGDIALAFFLLGAPASLIVGFFADTHDRRKLFGCTVFVGEMACFFTYFVRTYNQLFLCRALTGFSIGGALPVIYSILGDLFGAGGMYVVFLVLNPDFFSNKLTSKTKLPIEINLWHGDGKRSTHRVCLC